MVTDTLWAEIEAMPSEVRLDLAAAIVQGVRTDQTLPSQQELAELDDAIAEYRTHPDALLTRNQAMTPARSLVE